MAGKDKYTMNDWLVSFLYRSDLGFEAHEKGFFDEDMPLVGSVLKKLKSFGYLSCRVGYTLEKGQELRIRYYGLTKAGIMAAMKVYRDRQKEQPPEELPEPESIGKNTVSVSYRIPMEQLKTFKQKFIQLNLL